MKIKTITTLFALVAFSLRGETVIFHNGKIEPDLLAEIRGYETYSTNLVMYELWPDGLRYYRNAYQWDMWNTGGTSYMWDYNFIPYPDNTEVGNSNANTMIMACPRDARDIIVAVVDSGVKTSHPEFQGNLYISDDLFGHGTMIAGIIGARGVEMKGVSTNVQIIGFKTSFRLSEILLALQSAIDGGARIINCSWGFLTEPSSLKTLIDYGESRGVIFVCATRNGAPINMDQYLDFPSSWRCTNVVMVTSTTPDDNLYAVYGKNTIHLGAPGRNIVSAHVYTNYMYGTGTSYAVPHVVGALAVLMQAFPEEDHHMLIDRLLSSVDKIPSCQNTISGGRLNLWKAFQYLPPRLTIKNGLLTATTTSMFPRAIVCSSDLVTWISLTNVTTDATVQIDMSQPSMFYRLR